MSSDSPHSSYLTTLIWCQIPECRHWRIGVEDRITEFLSRSPVDGSFGPEPDVRLWRRQWAGCKGRFPGEWTQPSVTEVHPGTWQESWDCPGAEVRGLTVEGLGHAWPSTLGLDLTRSPNQTADFNFHEPVLGPFLFRGINCRENTLGDNGHRLHPGTCPWCHDLIGKGGCGWWLSRTTRVKAEWPCSWHIWSESLKWSSVEKLAEVPCQPHSLPHIRSDSTPSLGN